MAIEHMASVLHHSTLSGAAKLVLLGIANHMSDAGAWPTIETLAIYGGCSERTVQRCIAEAVAAGELEVHVQDGGTHRTRADRRPNRYRVLVACPDDCDGTPNHRRKPVDNPPCGVTPLTPRPRNGTTPTTPRSGNGVTPVTPRGDTGVTQTIREPSEVQTLLSTADAADESETPQSPPILTAADLARPPGSPNRKPQDPHCPPGGPCACRDTGNRDLGVCFPAFWWWWPGRKAQRAHAKRAWDRAVRTTDPAVIVAAAAALNDDPNLPGKQFLPLPAKWLDSQGWADEPYPPRTNPTARPPEPPTRTPPRLDPSALLPADAVPMPAEIRDRLRLAVTR